MKKKDIVCIICPNGCEISIDYLDENNMSISGAICDKGKEYARSEIYSPVRIVTTSVAVLQGELPLTSVKTDKPIPLEKIKELMGIIQGIVIEAPVVIGEIIQRNPGGLEVNLIATRSVSRVKQLHGIKRKET